MKCTYYGQDSHSVIKCFKNPQGESYKVKPANSNGSKNRQFNEMNAAEEEAFKPFKTRRESHGKNGYNPP